MPDSSHMRGFKWSGWWSVLILLLAVLAASSAQAQSYLSNIGVPAFTTQLPVENGFVNVANGNLHLEIPLGSYPQRGGAVDKIVLMYDSAIYFNASGYWSPTNFSSSGGWRLVTSGDVGSATSGEYDYGWCYTVSDYNFARYTPWIWSAPDGTQHSFSVTTQGPLYAGITGCSSAVGTPNASGYATDGSGFYISITNYSDAVIYAPDGTKIDTVNAVKTDPNGNQYQLYTPSEYFDTLSQTLNRAVALISSGTNTVTYSLPNAQAGDLLP